MKKGVVIVKFTIGFGNNLFQYSYARLLAEKLGIPLVHQAIEQFNIPEQRQEIDSSLDFIYVSDNNCKATLKSDENGVNYYVNGYFEDYTIYEPYLDKIRSWFPKQKKENNNDLILHFRLQNRLIQKTHCINHVPFEVFEKGINKFDFEKLHIVTDAKKWDLYSKQDIEEIQEEIRIGPNPPSKSPWVETQYSVDYVNHLIEGFSKYDLEIHCNQANMIPGSGGLRGNFMDDFNLLRKFDKIMFKDSTFSWWAALLSEASQVAAYGPWKPNKGDKNKNLGVASFPGWFSWGS